MQKKQPNLLVVWGKHISAPFGPPLLRPDEIEGLTREFEPNLIHEIRRPVALRELHRMLLRSIPRLAKHGGSMHLRSNEVSGISETAFTLIFPCNGAESMKRLPETQIGAGPIEQMDDGPITGFDAAQRDRLAHQSPPQPDRCAA